MRACDSAPGARAPGGSSGTREARTLAAPPAIATGPAMNCGTDHGLAWISRQTYCGVVSRPAGTDSPKRLNVGTSITRTPPISSPSTNSVTTVTPITTPRARCPTNQYPSPGTAHPAAVIGVTVVTLFVLGLL